MMKQLIEKSGTSKQTKYCTQIYLLLRHFNKFSFSHASMKIKVSNKVLDTLNRIYLNEYYVIILVIYFNKGFLYY